MRSVNIAATTVVGALGFMAFTACPNPSEWILW